MKHGDLCCSSDPHPCSSPSLRGNFPRIAQFPIDSDFTSKPLPPGGARSSNPQVSKCLSPSTVPESIPPEWLSTYFPPKANRSKPTTAATVSINNPKQRHQRSTLPCHTLPGSAVQALQRARASAVSCWLSARQHMMRRVTLEWAKSHPAHGTEH